MDPEGTSAEVEASSDKGLQSIPFRFRFGDLGHRVSGLRATNQKTYDSGTLQAGLTEKRTSFKGDAKRPQIGRGVRRFRA